MWDLQDRGRFLSYCCVAHVLDAHDISTTSRPPPQAWKSLARHKASACSGATPFLADDDRRLRLTPPTAARRISVHSPTSPTLPLQLQVYNSRTDDK